MDKFNFDREIVLFGENCIRESCCRLEGVFLSIKRKMELFISIELIVKYESGKKY